MVERHDVGDDGVQPPVRCAEAEFAAQFGGREALVAQDRGDGVPHLGDQGGERGARCGRDPQRRHVGEHRRDATGVGAAPGGDRQAEQRFGGAGQAPGVQRDGGERRELPAGVGGRGEGVQALPYGVRQERGAAQRHGGRGGDAAAEAGRFGPVRPGGQPVRAVRGVRPGGAVRVLGPDQGGEFTRAGGGGPAPVGVGDPAGQQPEAVAVQQQVVDLLVPAVVVGAEDEQDLGEQRSVARDRQLRVAQQLPDPVVGRGRGVRFGAEVDQLDLPVVLVSGDLLAHLAVVTGGEPQSHGVGGRHGGADGGGEPAGVQRSAQVGVLGRGVGRALRVPGLGEPDTELCLGESQRRSVSTTHHFPSCRAVRRGPAGRWHGAADRTMGRRDRGHAGPGA